MKINNIETKATLFAYDDCHKMYIIEDEQDLKEAKESGYTILPIKELENTYNHSCPLRFISNWKLTISFIEQCQDENTFEYDENFWCKPNWKTILKKSIIIDYENDENLLDYDDDTELCGYYKDGDRYGIWLAVYDGYLEWTLDDYADEDGIIQDYAENIACEIWNTDKELNETPLCDITKDFMKEMCKQKLKEMIDKYVEK